MRKQLPISGQERQKRMFALFPIRCNSQQFVWLEWVTILQRYTYGHDSVREGWENIKIVEDKE